MLAYAAGRYFATAFGVLLIPFVTLCTLISRFAGIEVDVRYHPLSVKGLLRVFGSSFVIGLFIGVFTVGVPHLEEFVATPSADEAAAIHIASQHLDVESKIRSLSLYYGVPPKLALAIGRWETGLQHFDRQGRVKQSSANAIGIYQLKPVTAADMDVDPYDLDQNIVGGVRYIKFIMSHFDEPHERRGYSVPPQLATQFKEDPVAVLTIASYHAGIGRVMRSKGIPSRPGGEWNQTVWEETIKYTQGVFALKQKS